jgi:hypothetical protein
MKKNPVTLIVLLLLSVNALSQIEGDVRDKDDKRIPKAIIIARDTANRIVDSVMTDDDGFYSFKNLKPGIFIIEAKAAGFQTMIYKNVIARQRILNPAAGNDVTNATRLQIVLAPVKKSKQ